MRSAENASAFVAEAQHAPGSGNFIFLSQKQKAATPSLFGVAAVDDVDGISGTTEAFQLERVEP
jgi:hypothetical protein